MEVNRRNLLTATAGAGAAAATATVADTASAAAPPLLSALGRDATHFGVRPGSPDDQTAGLQRAINEAARANAPLALPAGVYRCRTLQLPANAQIVGVRGGTKFAFGGGSSLFTCDNAANVSLAGLVLDGGAISLGARRGLIHAERCRDVRIVDCEVINSGANAIWFEQVSGDVRNNTFRNILSTALVSFDAQGLLVAQNTILGTRNNGIEILRHQAGDDGTLVIDNRIEDIVAGPGGTGQHGNAINAFRAANVIVRGNRIRNCEFSGIRGNSASNIQIIGNSLTNMREVAIYSEFAFEGAVIANTTVDICAIGAVACNYNEGGRVAVVQGNIFRNMLTKRPSPLQKDDGAGIGIAVEADAAVSGNVIENAPSYGIIAGWGRYLRDVAITGNVVRNADVGIGVSVTPGAGNVLVSDNVISSTQNGAVVGFDHHRRITGDLTQQGASKFAQLAIGSNLVR